MSGPIAFTFAGVPVAKGRPRALARIVKQGGIARAIVQLITPPETRKAEDQLQKMARSYMGPRQPFAGPVRMMIVAVYAPPPSWTKTLHAALATGVVYHTSKPDADNLAKLVGDALNEIAYQDDSQVAELVVRKRYGTPTRTDITITQLESAGMTPADKRRAAEAPQPETSPRLL
jgi:Holliday junction resolvase RusA-like endonuclease